MLRRTGSRVVYENRWMRVREDDIVRADGTPSIYAVIERPDFALVVPAEDDGSVWLVEQHRYPVGERFWEFPQGSWQDRPDADPAELARGELEEETGLRATTLQPLGYLHQSYGSSSQGFHVWLATGLTKGEPDRELEEQDMVERRFSREAFHAMARDGRIRDASSLAAWALFTMEATP
jgi:8-oxo-dGTP pyrophosphatase MutT (NUDIX family)